MNKLKLSLDELAVESFAVTEDSDGQAGTVRGFITQDFTGVCGCVSGEPGCEDTAPPTSIEAGCDYATRVQDCCGTYYTDNEPECRIPVEHTYWCSRTTAP